MASIVRKARALATGIRTAEDVISAVGMVLLLVMMFLGAGDVVGRYVFMLEGMFVPLHLELPFQVTKKWE